MHRPSELTGDWDKTSEGDSVMDASEGDPAVSTSSRDAILSASEGDPVHAVPNPTQLRGRSNDNESPFVNLDTLGLRRSTRISKNPKRTPYGLMVLALVSLNTEIQSSINSVTQISHLLNKSD